MKIREDIIKHYEDWWEGKNTEPVFYYGYREEAFDPAPYKKSWMYHKLDTGWAVAQALELIHQGEDFRILDEALEMVRAWHQGERFLGDGFPNYFFNLGPGCLAANITGFSKFGDNTNWFELTRPMPYEAITSLPEDVRTEYAVLTGRAMKAAAEKLADTVAISQADLGGTVDILASLRSTHQLLYDTMDEDPETIKQSLAKIDSIWKRYYDEYDALYAPKNGGLRSSWMPILSKKRYYPLQCDFGAMISPATFREFTVPALERLCAFLDRAIFHLDGPEMIPHLPLLADIKGINAIQWTAGDGEAPLEDECWFDLYKKIIDSGKKIVLLGYPASEEAVRRLFARFPKREFYLMIWGSDRETGERLLRMSGNI
ncbi:MAG: hypothetical protein ACM3WV_04445 [Bacillota bacterium]